MVSTLLKIFAPDGDFMYIATEEDGSLLLDDVSNSVY